MTSAHALANLGWTTVPTQLTPDLLATLRDELFAFETAGTRCLLDVSCVQQATSYLRTALCSAALLPASAVAIQAIAFDKTATTNWKVTWHQDLMFPLAQPATEPGYELPSKKDGINYARPPRDILESLLAVRLHLDDCDATNGPLRVSPGTHRQGVIRSTDLAATVTRHGESSCQARTGDALLMKPLLLHASSSATTPRHRRVLHLVFHAGPPPAERWHRCV